MNITTAVEFQPPTVARDRLPGKDAVPIKDGQPLSNDSTALLPHLKSPSTIVELSQTEAGDPALYSNKPIAAVLESSPRVESTVLKDTQGTEFPNLLTQTLLRNQNLSGLKPDSFEGIFSGLGALAKNNRSQSQLVGKVTHDQSLQDLSMEKLDKGRQSREIKTSVELRITTKDGDEITLTVRALTDKGRLEAGSKEGYSFLLNGVSVDFELDGELDETEITALENLGFGMEKLYKSLNGPAGPDISGLNLFDQGLFSSVAVSFVNSGNESFKLSAKDTDQQRSLAMSYKGNNVRMLIDKSDLGSLISESQHRAAVSHYLELIDNSVEKSRGSDIQHSMMGQTFSKMNEGVTQGTASPALTSPQAGIQQLRINNPEEILLTGLPDFEFTFNSVVERPNLINGKPEEFSGFTLKMEQKTQALETRDAVQINQSQTYELSAGYYRPLPGLEQAYMGAEYQSYQYFRIEEDHSKNIKQRFEHGNSVSIDMTESSESSKEHIIYDYNKLTHHQVDKDETLDVKTLNAQQVHQYKQQLMALIDPDLMISP